MIDCVASKECKRQVTEADFVINPLQSGTDVATGVCDLFETA